MAAQNAPKIDTERSKHRKNLIPYTPSGEKRAGSIGENVRGCTRVFLLGKRAVLFEFRRRSTRNEDVTYRALKLCDDLCLESPCRSVIGCCGERWRNRRGRRNMQTWHECKVDSVIFFNMGEFLRSGLMWPLKILILLNRRINKSA